MHVSIKAFYFERINYGLHRDKQQQHTFLPIDNLQSVQAWLWTVGGSQSTMQGEHAIPHGKGRAGPNVHWLCFYVCLFVFRPLEADIKENFLTTIGDVFGMERTEATDLYTLLLQCMDHRQSVSKAASEACVCCDWGHWLLNQRFFEQQITIFDSESDDQMAPDAAILTATLKGTCFLLNYQTFSLKWLWFINVGLERFS